MSKALAKSRNHPKGEECCDMSFEGLSPELMLCVRIRRERLWCSRPASKRSRQVFRRLLDQTAWDPNLGSRRVLRPILPRTEVSERQPPFRQDARTQIDRPSRDVRTHRAKENTCYNHFARQFYYFQVITFFSLARALGSNKLSNGTSAPLVQTGESRIWSLSIRAFRGGCIVRWIL